MTTIVWFRHDLRLRDNPALTAAAARGTLVPVFIVDETDRDLRAGAASRWWLHHSLAALAKQLGHLSFFNGDPRVILPDLVRQTKATAVFWNRCYEPHAIARDTDVKAVLKRDGIDAQSFNGALLHEPWDIKTGSGGPYKVFTPYWRAARTRQVPAPLPAPKHLKTRAIATSKRLDDLRLLPVKPNWAAGWRDHWTPGEQGAFARFESFVADDLAPYGDMRDRPDKPGTSRLSPHLHFGEISPRQIYARLSLDAENDRMGSGAAKFLSEIGWREFAHHLLHHYPTLPDKNWRQGFDAYPWRDSARDLKAWQRGQTGYPLVDAGMRELWQPVSCITACA